jgi:uncharacterized protein (UPF0332 family)
LQSYLKEKSNCNLLAAQLLHEHQRYAAVPHCAYYACLQQIKYILCVKFNKYCDDNELSGKNTHVVIWNEFWKQINIWNEEYQILSRLETVLLEKYFINLKINRINSDYNHKSIGNLYLSEESLNFAVEFTYIIQKISYE